MNQKAKAKFDEFHRVEKEGEEINGKNTSLSRPALHKDSRADKVENYPSDQKLGTSIPTRPIELIFSSELLGNSARHISKFYFFLYDMGEVFTPYSAATLTHRSIPC